MRLLLVKASRVIKRRATTSPRAAVVATRLDDILKKEVVAGREYFCRVWTLAERMARLGRREQLCHWLSLEAWLGMLVDALIKSTEDRWAKHGRRGRSTEGIALRRVQVMLDVGLDCASTPASKTSGRARQCVQPLRQPSHRTPARAE